MSTPEPSTVESMKTHNRSEYRWKKIMFKPAHSKFVRCKLKLVRLNHPCHTSYFSVAIFQELAFETNKYNILTSDISIKTTEQEIGNSCGCLWLWLILNFKELG